MNTYDEILEAMRLKYRELSGFDPDNASDIGIRLKVLAAQVFEVYGRLANLSDQVFPQTSSGQYLEMHAQTRGITRKQALPSRGRLRFSREVPAINDISISEGIICSTRPGPQVQFRTTQPGILQAGETHVDIPAEAVDPGEIGNVAALAVHIMITPAPGITGASNPSAFYGGVDEEGDAALRERLLLSYSNISNGTNRAFYHDIAMSRDGVRSVNVISRARGRGTVDVVISAASLEMEGEIVKELQAEMQEQKEINVDVRVLAAIRDELDVSVDIAVREGFSLDIVAENCQKAIQSLITGLGVGQPLLITQLGNTLFSVDGVYNYRVTSPQRDIFPLNNYIIVPGEISVQRMAVGQ